MGNIETIEKIMDVRISEKNKIQQNYKNAVEHFEEKASALYQLLKEKENAEADSLSMLSHPLKVSAMQHNHRYIQKLNQAISELQSAVHYARKDMILYQNKLTDAQIEVKKYSKIIDYRLAEKKRFAIQEENKLMDEISVRQFISNGIR